MNRQVEKEGDLEDGILGREQAGINRLHRPVEDADEPFDGYSDHGEGRLESVEA